MDASTIFTSKMMDEMMEIVKRGKDRDGSSHETMRGTITHMLDEFGMAVDSPDDASTNTGFDYRATRMRIINPSDYVCDNKTLQEVRQPPHVLKINRDRHLLIVRSIAKQ